jgi:hypothetical protein
MQHQQNTINKRIINYHRNYDRVCIRSALTVTRDIYPRYKYYHVIVYGGKIAAASKQAHRSAEL